MQKISRIYLGGCGFRTAWYEGMVIPLTDPAGDATDTILHLENGGGKTTLLSLVFSCFDTEQSRFLKHLQEKVNRFSQYFNQEGVPGFIAVEWVMPPRTANGTPYRLVVGQAVSVRAATEDVERIFFSFEERADLSLESLPAPNLSTSPVTSLAEFSRWIQDKKSGNTDVYHTRLQAEWKKHLKSDRMLDVEMLQMQVNFSAQEGGFDTFVKFKSEDEFLRKFMGLTLDPSKAEEARRLVVGVCEKHARKPEYERRSAELTKFRGTLTAFSEAARQFLDASAKQAHAAMAGVQLSQALTERQAVSDAAERAERELERQHSSASVGAGANALNLIYSTSTATRQLHIRRTEEAKAASDAAKEDVERLEKESKFIRAAKMAGDINALSTEIAQFEEQAKREEQNLKPALDDVERQGALLRRALFTEEEARRSTVTALEKREKERKETLERLAKDKRNANQLKTQLSGEEQALKAAEQRREGRLQALVSEGLLQSVEEDVGAAAAALLARAAQHENESEAHRAERTRKRARAKQLRDERDEANNQAQAYGQTARRWQAFIAEAEAETERLSQLAALREAVGADTVDPHSALLPTSLAELISSLSGQIAAVDVRLAELNLTSNAIQTTRVAGASADVNHVVQVLRRAGVQSARPYNEYIANAIPDAERARELVLSDPARFSGVCVSRAEFEKARAVDWAGQLPRKPVMVSVTTVDKSGEQAERTVVPAENDAAFNFQAAAKLQPEIATSIEQDQALRAGLADRHRRAVKAEQELAAFLNKYSTTALADARINEATAAQDGAAAKSRAEGLARDGEQLDKEASALDDAISSAGGLAATARANSKRLTDFASEHDAGRTQRLYRLGELPGLIAQAQEDEVVAEARAEELQLEDRDEWQKRKDAERVAQDLSQERSALQFYDKGYDARAHLEREPQPLDVLRRLYRGAEDNYKAKEGERLGQLAFKLKEKRKQREELSAEYTRSFPGVTTPDIKPYMGGDYLAQQERNASELKAARDALAEKQSAHSVAKKEGDTWLKQNQSNVRTPGPELLAMGIPELEEVVARGEREQLEQFTRQREEGEKARAALSRAEQARAQAQRDRDANQLLLAGLHLGESPDLARLLAETQAATGVMLDPSTLPPLVLQQSASSQVTELVKAFGTRGSEAKKLDEAARKAFDKVKAAASTKEFMDADAAVAQQMQENSFADTCRDAERIVTHLDDRIATTDATLANMQADFDACIEEVAEVVRIAILTLQRACSPDKCVPSEARYIGGKQVLKMRASFQGINTEARKLAMRHYLDLLTETRVIPATGTDMVADCVQRIYGKPLGLQVLKMSVEESEQYVAVDKISNSGGEGVVMAMFLYLLINQLRAENYADVHKSAGGPLLLDNPFAKVTSGAMWNAQRLLAKSMNVQLIFATAVEDYNALGEFERFVRLRKAGNHSKTKRWHIEQANYTFTPAAETATA